jgi:MFS family permease
MTKSELSPIDHPLKIADFRYYFGARLLAVLAGTALSAAVSWHIYELSRQTMDIGPAALMIGFFGLAQFIAQFLLTIPAGIVVDRVRRKTVGLIVFSGYTLNALLLWAYAAWDQAPLWGFFIFGISLGALRAFSGPAMTAMGPMLVPTALMPRAIGVSSVAFQTGMMVGPALGGALLAQSLSLPYSLSALCFGLGLILVAAIKSPTQPPPPTGTRLMMLKEGIDFVRNSPKILGAMSLDLITVFLAGATALLPIFTRDVLQATEAEYGLLRAALPAGALIVSLYLSWNPLRRHAGPWIFGSMALFGLSTVVFGLSKVFWLSCGALFVVGMVDSINMYVRGTLVQIVTPDAMRGRVSSVSLVFIGASNELGEFQSGVAARLLGPVMAAVLGGLGATLATGLWIKLFPELYNADRLEPENDPNPKP